METEIPNKRSYLRKDIEQALKDKGIVLERRISLFNLDTNEVYYFDDYYDAIGFIKGKKSRWYLTYNNVTTSCLAKEK